METHLIVTLNTWRKVRTPKSNHSG